MTRCGAAASYPPGLHAQCAQSVSELAGGGRLALGGDDLGALLSLGLAGHRALHRTNTVPPSPRPRISVDARASASRRGSATPALDSKPCPPAVPKPQAPPKSTR
jgi:hypothetical protein